MKLTDFIMNVGRVVAYYPNLKKITGSTTATILLCQLLYWSDGRTGKDSDGWIWKNSKELEEETGLSYSEQRTARRLLRMKGFVEEKNRRLDHQMFFRVNFSSINSAWEAVYGEPDEKEKAQKLEEEKKRIEEEKRLEEEKKRKQEEEALIRQRRKEEYDKRKAAQKRGDMVDMYIDASRSSGIQKVNMMDYIEGQIKVKFRVNPSGKRWEKFIEYAAGRALKHNESIDQFIEWALLNGFDAIFWTPDKMETIWPQAFPPEENTIDENDIPVVKSLDDEEIAPMPDSLWKRVTKKD